ncbi:hydrogenase maturation nickel metallochaperone HypA [Escherichia coli]
MYHTQGVAPCCLVAGVAKLTKLSLCQSAVEIIQRQAEQHDVKRVTAVWLEMACSPALRRAPSVLVLKLSATGTVAKGCDLHIVYKPAQAWCWDCSQVVEIHQHDAQCPVRHGERLRVDTGDSLIVKSIEVE